MIQTLGALKGDRLLLTARWFFYTLTRGSVKTAIEKVTIPKGRYLRIPLRAHIDVADPGDGINLSSVRHPQPPKCLSLVMRRQGRGSAERVQRRTREAHRLSFHACLFLCPLNPLDSVHGCTASQGWR